MNILTFFIALFYSHDVQKKSIYNVVTMRYYCYSTCCLLPLLLPTKVATLLFVTGEDAIHHLFSRNTHVEFDYGPLVTVLVVYFVLACWSAGTAVSVGLVVPML